MALKPKVVLILFFDAKGLEVWGDRVLTARGIQRKKNSVGGHKKGRVHWRDRATADLANKSTDEKCKAKELESKIARE